MIVLPVWDYVHMRQRSSHCRSGNIYRHLQTPQNAPWRFPFLSECKVFQLKYSINQPGFAKPPARIFKNLTDNAIKCKKGHRSVRRRSGVPRYKAPVPPRGGHCQLILQHTSLRWAGTDRRSRHCPDSTGCRLHRGCNGRRTRSKLQRSPPAGKRGGYP